MKAFKRHCITIDLIFSLPQTAHGAGGRVKIPQPVCGAHERPNLEGGGPEEAGRAEPNQGSKGRREGNLNYFLKQVL